MDERAALEPGRAYGVKHTTRWTRATVSVTSKSLPLKRYPSTASRAVGEI